MINSRLFAPRWYNCYLITSTFHWPMRTLALGCINFFILPQSALGCINFFILPLRQAFSLVVRYFDWLRMLDSQIGYIHLLLWKIRDIHLLLWKDTLIGWGRSRTRFSTINTRSVLEGWVGSGGWTWRGLEMGLRPQPADFTIFSGRFHDNFKTQSRTEQKARETRRMCGAIIERSGAKA